jgi:hypothetical protein
MVKVACQGCRALARVSSRRFVLSFALLVLSACGSPLAQAQASREYDLKAVFLYNLASFVDWPPSAFELQDSPFVIGVIGDDPFGGVLDEVVRNEFRGRHPLVVRRFGRSDDIRACHILFVSESESHRLQNVLRQVRGHPILTVADLPGFVEVGGMIGFETQDDRLALFVNPSAVSAVNLTLSSKLLEVSQIVDAVTFSP